MSRYYALGKDRQDQYNLMQEQRRDSLNKYAAFTENTQIYFLSEALNYVLGKCIKDESADANYAREICREFVKEEGYGNLMRKFATKTHTLADIEQCVREACDSVTCKTDKDNNLTWTINDTEQIKFFDSLKNMPVDKVTSAVYKKVCDATEKFVQNNINMKLDIEKIATKTKERIDAAKEKYNDEMADKIQKEQMIAYKREVDDLKSRAPRNVYEHMMNITSKVVMEDEQLRESFVDESGKFDISKVESKVKTMYTFLEMVNSLKIKKINNKYIEECLSSIK